MQDSLQVETRTYHHLNIHLSGNNNNPPTLTTKVRNPINPSQLPSLASKQRGQQYGTNLQKSCNSAAWMPKDWGQFRIRFSFLHFEHHNVKNWLKQQSSECIPKPRCPQSICTQPITAATPENQPTITFKVHEKTKSFLNLPKNLIIPQDATFITFPPTNPTSPNSQSPHRLQTAKMPQSSIGTPQTTTTPKKNPIVGL